MPVCSSGGSCTAAGPGAGLGRTSKGSCTAADPHLAVFELPKCAVVPGAIWNCHGRAAGRGMAGVDAGRDPVLPAAVVVRAAGGVAVSLTFVAADDGKAPLPVAAVAAADVAVNAASVAAWATAWRSSSGRGARVARGSSASSLWDGHAAMHSTNSLKPANKGARLLLWQCVCVCVCVCVCARACVCDCVRAYACMKGT
eukprot:scaffold4220_cov16-Tisochrysis_lutea.AAC.1